MPMVIEEFREFAQRMDCDYITVPMSHGPVYLFENGAASDGRHNHKTPDSMARLPVLRGQLQYVETKLEEELYQREQFKRDCMNRLRMAKDQGSPSMLPHDAPARLDAMDASIKALQKRRTELKKEIEADPPIKQQLEREQHRKQGESDMRAQTLEQAAKLEKRIRETDRN